MFLFRRLVFLTMLFALLPFSGEAFADVDKVVRGDATIQNLTKFLYQQKKLDFDNLNQFKEYMMIENCQVFEEYYQNDFDWNRIRRALKKEYEGQKESINNITKIRIPSSIELDRYNFNTQSFDIGRKHVFEDVSLIQMTPTTYELCDNKLDNKDLEHIPREYILKPEIPFSLFRIPVSKAIVESLLDKMTTAEGKRFAYVDINVSLEAFFDVDNKSDNKTAYILGRVESVDFYTDPYRENKFKTLYYDVY